MNVKEMIEKLNGEYCEAFDKEVVGMDELLLTIISKFQLFEPCKYLSEDDEWLNVAILSIENEDTSQPLTIRKDEITTLGVFNQDEVETNFTPQVGTQDLYQ